MPTNFQFYHKNYDTVYTCHVDREEVLVSWVLGVAGFVSYSTECAERYIREGTWIIIPETTLPSEFLFKVSSCVDTDYDPLYKMTKVATGYACTLANEIVCDSTQVHPDDTVEMYINTGIWIIVDEVSILDKAIEDAEANYRKVMHEAIQRVRKAKEDRLNYLKEQA